jgi:hypothetical protein
MSEHPERKSLARSRSSNRLARSVSVALAVAVMVIGVTACGDDDDDAPSAEDTFCEAGDSLQSDLEALVSLDIIAGGTDALDESFEAVKSDVDALSDSGEEVASDDIEAFESSLDALGDAIDSLGEDISVEGATAAATAIAGVVDSSNAIYETLSTTCG